MLLFQPFNGGRVILALLFARLGFVVKLLLEVGDAIGYVVELVKEGGDLGVTFVDHVMK